MLCCYMTHTVTKTQPLLQRAASTAALSDVFDVILHLTAKPVTTAPGAAPVSRITGTEMSDTVVRAGNTSLII
jgi:hypothetical protein